MKQFVSLRDALIQEKASIETRLREINQALGTPAPDGAAVTSPAPASVVQRSGRSSKTGKRRVSDEARAKMAEAQRRRREREQGGETAAATAPTATPSRAAKPASNGKPKKRVMTEEQKAKLSAAQRKIWAERKKAQGKKG